MQPNKKTITIFLVTILILVAAIIIFKNDKNTEPEIMTDTSSDTSSETNTGTQTTGGTTKTTTTTSKTQTKTSTSTTTKTYTVRDFINQEGLDNQSCDITIPAEGKIFTITGYINPADVWEAQYSKVITMRNVSDISADAVNLRLTSTGINTLLQKYNKDKTTWIKTQAHGTLRGVLSQVSDVCTKGFILETDSIKILVD